MTLQYFLNYNIGSGWAVGTAPVITADWKADSDGRWTIPLLTSSDGELYDV